MYDACNDPILGRYSIPTWLIQPITHSVPVWEVVESRLPSFMSNEKAATPAYQNPDVVAGVVNLTGNWLSNMAVSISQAVCGSRLSRLSSGTQRAVLPEPAPPISSPPAKRQRVPDKHGTSRHIVVPVRPAPDAASSKKKKKKLRMSPDVGERSHVASSSGAGPSGAEETLPPSSAPLSSRTILPSRSYYSSPFYTLTPIWRDALEGVSPVVQPPASSVYFYPPPFLLDTISTLARLPDGSPHPEAARVDEKVHRYLHNLVRIRPFCRMRLFSPTMTSHPMTIVEWRVALWGQYSEATFTPPTVYTPSVRRAKRRKEERNVVGRLLTRVGLIPTYRDDMTPHLETVLVTLADAATDIRIRGLLLWESHEVNFRCELLALDTALVQQKDWSQIDRWGREAVVSGVWGDPLSAVSVIPSSPSDTPGFRWILPPDVRWRDCRIYLARFIAIVMRWPGTPQTLLDARRTDPNTWTEDEYTDLQRVLVDFYVRTFVSNFHRLPIPPIPYFTSSISTEPAN